MPTPLQEQLLKAGLIKKNKMEAAVREQNRRRDGKAPPPPAEEQVNAQQLLAQRAERDRALAAEANAKARARELQNQIRAIVASHRVKPEGEIAYRFTDAGAIRSILVGAAQRKLLASGGLTIAQHEDSYALLPRAAADMVYERGGSLALDHARGNAQEPAATDADDEYYKKFAVPDDLIW